MVDKDGVRPDPANVAAVTQFPVPKSIASVHSFVGLVSYFRRFIENFSILAAPLYALLKKGAQFKFGEKESQAFEILKSKLVQMPILALYSPTAETEVHCDASALGYGVILLQKQKDNLMHPVFYYSKRTTETEAKYHSYELECLALVYAVKRFHVYLNGIRFKVFTDCESFKLTMNKKHMNPRIARWALLFQNYDFSIEHRAGSRMKHVDALSRNTNILILTENTFEQTLSIKQIEDRDINKLKEQLSRSEDKYFEMRNGLVYRKYKDGLLFYVPGSMEASVIRSVHEEYGHLGVEKTSEVILRTFWFLNLREKVKSFISNCLKCITYSPVYGRKEGELHSIPKTPYPFDTIHIDHYGPLEKTGKKNKYLFVIIDAFTKFVRLYPCKTTNAVEVIKYMHEYFRCYSKPRRVVSDRGSAFTSNAFKEFLTEARIDLVLVATATPRGNGQVERVNRCITAILSKKTVTLNKWDKVLSEVEYALNNMTCASTGEAPSKLLFGVHQGGSVESDFKKLLVEMDEEKSLEEIREEAEHNILKNQSYNKKYYDKKHKKPTLYKKGDFVMIKNTDVSGGVNKKLIPKFKGPYIIYKVLPNDRFIVKDIEGFQHTQMPYEGVMSSDNMRHWIRTVEE